MITFLSDEIKFSLQQTQIQLIAQGQGISLEARLNLKPLLIIGRQAKEQPECNFNSARKPIQNSQQIWKNIQLMPQLKPSCKGQVSVDLYPHQEIDLESPSSYPSSLLNSQLQQPSKESRMQQLSEKQQEIVSSYLALVQRKDLKQLLMERDKLLAELHSINSHLNEMISQVYGDLESFPNDPSNFQLERNAPSGGHQKPQLNNRLSKNNAKQGKNIDQLSEQQFMALETKNRKQIESLKKELTDFQFMLTGQYIDELEDEITKSQTIKKQLHYEVALLDKQTKKHTKAFDKQTIAKLQKSTYDTQIEFSLLSKKLQSRLLKLNAIENDIQAKSSKIQTLSNQETDLERLLQMYEDEEYEGEETSRKKKDNYQKLQTKKQKLQKIINSYNNNHLKLYNKKLCDFRSIDDNIQELKQTITKIDYRIVLVARERKQFSRQNKDILGSDNNISSFINPSKKTTLKTQKKPKYESTDMMRHKRQSEDNSVIKRNRMNFMSGSEKKDSGQSQIHKESLEIPKFQRTDLRRRIYTELESSHYFVSMQKNPTSKSIQTLEQLDRLPEDRMKNQNNQIRSLNSIQEKQIFIPTNDKPIVRNRQKLGVKSRKLQQKKFNLRNTPLINSQNNGQEQKDFSFYQASNNTSVRDVSQSRKSEEGKDYKKASIIGRKGVSHEIEKGSEDEIERRLIYLENLLKKGQTEEATFQQQEYRQEEEYREATSKISRNIYKSQRNDSEQLQSSLKSRVHVKSTKKPYSNKNYAELCKKLGKEKLLIEEDDEDISSLIYQGMAKNN